MRILSLCVTELLYFGNQTGQSGPHIGLTGGANDSVSIIGQFGCQMGSLSITSVGQDQLVGQRVAV